MRTSPMTSVRSRWDALSLSLEAVAHGEGTPHDWETLVAFCERDGVDSVADKLACSTGGLGGSRDTRDGMRGDARRWRCQLLLSMELAGEHAHAVTRELAVLEAAHVVAHAHARAHAQVEPAALRSERARRDEVSARAQPVLSDVP
jgi:hypothetical protein